jgi:hypothetical protein
MPAPPPELVPFRTAGGTLHTNGFTKTETLHRETGTWLGTTSSGIRLNATYRYDIELRSKGWNILIDDARHVAFVVAPPFRPQLPVAVASGSVEEWTQSGWGRFDKWHHLQALRGKRRPILNNWPGALATSKWRAGRPASPWKSLSPTGCSRAGAGRNMLNAW